MPALTDGCGDRSWAGGTSQSLAATAEAGTAVPGESTWQPCSKNHSPAQPRARCSVLARASPARPRAGRQQGLAITRYIFMPLIQLNADTPVESLLPRYRCRGSWQGLHPTLVPPARRRRLSALLRVGLAGWVQICAASCFTRPNNLQAFLGLAPGPHRQWGISSSPEHPKSMSASTEA